jgi:hypothetical protein
VGVIRRPSPTLSAPNPCPRLAFAYRSRPLHQYCVVAHILGPPSQSWRPAVATQRPRSNGVGSRRLFTQVATDWLRFIGRLEEPPTDRLGRLSREDQPVEREGQSAAVADPGVALEGGGPRDRDVQRLHRGANAAPIRSDPGPVTRRAVDHVLITSSSLASAIFATFSHRPKITTTKSERTYRCGRTRRFGVMCAEQGACVRRRPWAGYTINMFEFEFPTGTPTAAEDE